jgi:hypothetical protein
MNLNHSECELAGAVYYCRAIVEQRESVRSHVEGVQ